MPRRKALTNNNNAGETEPQPPKAKRARIAFHLELPKRRTVIGNVLVCGNGDVGQLGLGEDILERKRLSPVAGIPDAVDISAGGMHNLVLTKSGDIYSFGCNDEGALGRDTSEDGSESKPDLIDLPGKALCISAGDSHSACLLEDGRVFAWGSFRDSHGNMGLTIDGNKRTPIDLMEGTVCCSIASGADHLVILTTAGKVFTVGCAEQGQLGRLSERSISGEGRRGKRDLLRPTQLIITRAKPFEAIWATNYCTFMRESQTEVIWATGLNNFKQLAHETKGKEFALTPIKTELKDIRHIAGGQHHTVILTTDLKCSVVGRPEYGRLGLGDVKDVVEKPTIVKKLTEKIVSVGCGEVCSYAVTIDGKLYSWGSGVNNQLGVGDGDDELEPIVVVSKNTQGKHMLLASGGGQHAIFLVKADKQDQKENVPVKASGSSSKKDKTPPQDNADKEAENVDKQEQKENLPAKASTSSKKNKTPPQDNADKEAENANKQEQKENLPAKASTSSKKIKTPPQDDAAEKVEEESAQEPTPKKAKKPAAKRGGKKT
ncbi:regulator of chromosome condensation [Drosophila sechellia]|uniref:GM13884 n=1 Tax=Drosophila sechellia TaxID=7238 RepID=B4HUL5_DROSE|nr:regulator of chromosome condensation [Drosophila sechellia]XP_032576030.1 regulator of chromosome condensation [Drosophila sechellia]EDW50636.1 GM13884 [Drosophila sechellia]